MAKNKKKNKNNQIPPEAPVNKEEGLDFLPEQQLPAVNSNDLEKELLELFLNPENPSDENDDAASEAEELLKALKISDTNNALDDVEINIVPKGTQKMDQAEETVVSAVESTENISESKPEPANGSKANKKKKKKGSNNEKESTAGAPVAETKMDSVEMQETEVPVEEDMKLPVAEESAAEEVPVTEKRVKTKPPIKEGSPLHMVRLVVVLTAISAAVAGMLAVVNHVTKDTIAENDRKAREAAVLTVFPEGDSCKEYTTADGTTLYFAANGENLIGYCVNVSPAGYSGDIDMMVGIGADGTVSGIKIVSLSETPGVGTKVTGDSFLSQFFGIGGDEPLEVGVNVDGIGGATFSSKGVTDGVNEALSVEFDLYAAAAEVGLKVSDSMIDPGNNGDSNDDNGDETLNPETVGVADETEPAETEPVETEAPETNPAETEAPETAPVETEPEETEAPETTPWVPETNAPETTPWIPEPVETEPWIPEPVETDPPETSAPETAAPETVPPETEAPETEPVETTAPETVPPETAAPETEPAETEAPDPVSLELNMTLRAVDAEGNLITDVLDAQLNGIHWVSSAYTSDYTVNIGTNTIDGWDLIPRGYLAPEGIVFMVWEDGTVASYTSHVAVEADGSDVVFVVTLEEDPYAEYEEGNEVG